MKIYLTFILYNVLRSMYTGQSRQKIYVPIIAIDQLLFICIFLKALITWSRAKDME